MARQPETAYYQRVREAVRESGRSDTQVAIAKLLGIKQPSVSEWSRGESRPTTRHLEVLVAKTGFAMEYLRTGHGPRRAAAPPHDDDTLRELLSVWDKLSGDSRTALLQHAKLLRTIQITADPVRVREVHHELHEANERYRAGKPTRSR